MTGCRTGGSRKNLAEDEGRPCAVATHHLARGINEDLRVGTGVRLIAGGWFVLDLPLEVGVEEALDVAIEDGVEIAHRKAGTGIFDTLVGVLKVTADLAAKADASLGLILGRFRLFAFHFFEPSQLRAEHLPSEGSVLVLASLLLALYGNAGWEVRQANRAVGFIDVLAPCSAGPVGVGPDVCFVDFNFLRVLDFWRDIDRGETSLSFAFRVEGADPDEPVHSRLAFEVAVSHRPANGESGRINSGLKIVLAIEKFCGIVVGLCPVEIHSEHHLGPVVGIGAAIAGVDRHDRTCPIMRTIQKGFQFQHIESLLEPLDLSSDLARGGLVFFSQFHQRSQVIMSGDEFLQRADERLERLQLAYCLLGDFGAIPKAGLAHFLFDGANFVKLGFVVKDCLAFARLFAEFVLPG